MTWPFLVCLFLEKQKGKKKTEKKKTKTNKLKILPDGIKILKSDTINHQLINIPTVFIHMNTNTHVNQFYSTERSNFCLN